MTKTEDLLKKLKKIKKTKTYDAMARELGVSYMTVYRWLKGRNSPSGLALEKVERYVRRK